MNLVNALKWRYATKRMNGQIVPEEKINRILDAVQLSASSMGLQPYTLISIRNKKMRETLRPAAYNQPQFTEGSHVLVFAAWNSISETQVDEYLAHIANVRNESADSLADFRTSLLRIVNNHTAEEQYQWAARQAYIALGTAITAAAVERVDATPMEGFAPDEIDNILGLREKGLRSVAMLVLGYRDGKNDIFATARKVRRPKEKLILHVQ